MWNKMGASMKTDVIRARVPEHLKKEFEAAIGPHGLNVSHAIRLLMERYVAGEKEMKRRHAETLEALEDIASRRVVSGEKVLDWLAGWGTDAETEAP
jgi:antitoxin component of RelBE/YafQ-DinJ toxin-antitoxin module